MEQVLKQWLEYLSVVGLCALKFPFGVALSMGYKFTFWEQLLCTLLGGVLGTTSFTLGGAAIRRWWAQKFATKAPAATTIKGWQYQIWQRFGLVGLALLTPLLLGPPIGSTLAIALGAPKARTVAFMALSVSLWALTWAVFGQQLLRWTHGQF